MIFINEPFALTGLFMQGWLNRWCLMWPGSFMLSHDKRNRAMRSQHQQQQQQQSGAQMCTFTGSRHVISTHSCQMPRMSQSNDSSGSQFESQTLSRGGGLSTNHQSVEDQCDDWQNTAVAGVLVTKMSAEDILPSALLTKKLLIILPLTGYNSILIIKRD